MIAPFILPFQQAIVASPSPTVFGGTKDQVTSVVKGG